MPRGRPRKNPLPDDVEPKIEDLVTSPQYFEQEMRDFFQRGGMASLQRWLVAAQDRQKAEKIILLMTERFYQALYEIMPPENVSK